MPIVCSIGTTDPTAGAGIGVDLRVYARLRVRAMFVITAVTAQNSRRVFRVKPLSRDIIGAQLRAVWQEARPAAVRIGLIPSIEAMRAVFMFLARSKPRPPIVLDPVIAATSGKNFLQPFQVAELARHLPLVTLVTPNIAEAEALSGVRIANVADIERAAIAINARGCAALVKGGHLPGPRCVDVLAFDGMVVRFESKRLRRDMRGSGCLLAAAIAASLGRGRDLERAVRDGRRFVRAALRAAKPLGLGGRQFTF